MQAKLSAWFLLVNRLDYFDTLKMEAVRSSYTSVNLYLTIRRHIQEDSTVHDLRIKLRNSEIIGI
jgi:hypothetical protein